MKGCFEKILTVRFKRAYQIIVFPRNCVLPGSKMKV